MGVRENLQLIEREMEALNSRDWDNYLKCFARGVVTWEPDESELIRGRDALHRRVITYTTAFPDVRLVKERIFGDDTWVTLNALWTGTHRGPIGGPGGVVIRPTGRKVSVHGCSIFKIANGEIVEFIGYYDQVEMLNQLGVSFSIIQP
jgi:steroid delta-isomerase-like uncharacterized protein